MQAKSLKENIFYQGLYQTIRITTPLITIPIISKAFGPYGVGIISFSFTVMQYFLMFANVGIQLYFNRLIASSDDCKVERSRMFWNIYVSKLLVSLLVFLLYISIVYIYIDQYSIIFLLQGIYIIGAMFDISWFYAGIEEFKLPSLSNIIVSIILLICVIIFVNNSSDIIFYVFLLASINVLNQIPLYLNLKKRVVFTKINWTTVKDITYQSLAYLLPNGQLNLFTSINCFILGVFTTFNDVGIFTNTFNILNVAIILINTIDIVMIPRFAKLSKSSKEMIIPFLENNINIQLMLTIPMVLGIVSIMPKFYVWFFGDKFKETVPLMSILAILLCIIPLNMLISRQYLLLNKKITIYNISISAGIVINIIFSILLTPIWGIYGIGIARIITETFILIWRFWDIHDESVHINIPSLYKTIFSSLIMFTIIIYINNYFNSTWHTTVIDIMMGIIIFISLNLILKNHYAIMLIKGLINKGENQ